MIKNLPALRLTLFFTFNPDAKIDSRQIEEIMGIPRLNDQLNTAIAKEYVTRHSTTGGAGRRSLYEAGPRLKQLIETMRAYK